MRLLAQREANAKAKIAFLTGASEIHPHGVSGLRYILPYENDKRLWDTSPWRYEYSEFAFGQIMK